MKAYVTESLTNLTLEGTGKVHFYQHAEKMEFLDSNPSYFKPGFPYTAYVSIQECYDFYLKSFVSWGSVLLIIWWFSLFCSEILCKLKYISIKILQIYFLLDINVFRYLMDNMCTFILEELFITDREKAVPIGYMKVSNVLAFWGSFFSNNEVTMSKNI